MTRCLPVLFVLLPGLAWAQPPPEAESLAVVATRHFKAGNFQVAATLFLDAYAESGKPAVLYNAARAYEEARQPTEALRLFRLYLTVETDETGLVEARARIERLVTSAQAQPATSDLSQAATPTSIPLPMPPRTIRTRTWVTGGTALCLLVIGTVAAGLAANESHDLNARPGPDYAARFDRAERQWWAGTGTIGLGLGLGAYATWLAWKDRQ